MNTFEELQKWYLSQCDDNWEHDYGVTINNIDNPGWQIQIDLIDTDCEGKTFIEYSYGVEDEADTSGNNWLICKVQENTFNAYGGPEKLEEMIRVFLNWAKKK